MVVAVVVVVGMRVGEMTKNYDGSFGGADGKCDG